MKTQNCLQQLFQQGSIVGLGDLHNHTVGELLDMPNFGVGSLFDLLEAIKPFAKPFLGGIVPEVPTVKGDRLTVAQVDDILAKKSYPRLEIEHLQLPEITTSADLKNLPLKHRTRGCLEHLFREGCIREARDLSKIEISRLFSTANFGNLTFFDLLNGLRPYMLDHEEPTAAAPVELLHALEKLSNSSLCAKVRCNDPRFKRELLVLLTIAHNRCLSVTLSTDTITDLATRLSSAALSTAEARRALGSIKELRHAIRRTLHLRLERELRELVRSELDERSANIVSRVYGLDGRGATTLQEAGDEFGLTRERIRQICDRVAPLVKLQPFLPKLEMCIRFITPRLPNRADNIERAMLEHRLTQADFRLEGIRMAAELFNKAIRFDITAVNGIRIAVKTRKPAVANGNIVTCLQVRFEVGSLRGLRYRRKPA
jgi:hypothetical protein